MFLDELLERSTQRAISGEHQLEFDSAGDEHGGCLDQQQLALFRCETPDADETTGGMRRPVRTLAEGALQTAVHDLHPVPVPEIRPETQLTSSKRTDADDERCTPNLFPQAYRSKKFLRSVRREAVGRSAQRACQHRDIGRV